MPGFQFIHMQTYSRKPSKAGVGTSFVFGEAQRRPECSKHVEVPGQFSVVYGQDVASIEFEHDHAVEIARSVNVKGQSRKLRQDQHTLLTVVSSHPATPEQVASDPTVAKAVQDWQDRTVAWLRGTHGDRLRGVIRHDDESHVHLHAYVIPADPSMAARGLHPGVQAKKAMMVSEEAKGLPELAANRLGDKAYRDAMRGWQDDYWRAVGLPCGLTRLGPGRRRLSRADWQIEQAQVERVASLEPVLAKVGQAEDCIERGQATIAFLRGQVAAAMAERDAAVQAAEAAKWDADLVVAGARNEVAGMIAKAKREARAIIVRAQKEANRFKSIGAALGDFVQSIFASSPSNIEALVRAEEREKAALEVYAVRVELKELRGELRISERARVELADTVRTVATERDALRVQASKKFDRSLRLVGPV